MKYFSTFSGIGGFENGIERAFNNKHERQGGDSSSTSRNKRNDNSHEYEQKRSWPTCIGFSEIDKYAKAIYQYHYPDHKDYGDITDINVSELPNFDLFVGGFPCQAFSIAGKRQGFKDTRGTLFFDVARILKGKRPEWFLLENVKGLCSHDGGKTLGTIYRVLADIGYSVGWEVVNSCQFGVPQNRERIFIVGHLRAAGGRTGEILPFGENGILAKKTHKEKQGTGEGVQFQASGIANSLNKRMHKMGVDDNYVRLIADSGKGRKWEERDIAAPLRAGSAPGQHQKILSRTWRTHKDGEGFREVESGLAPTIPARAREDGSGQPVIKAVLTPDRLEKRQNGRRFKDNDEPSFTLTSQDKHGVQVGTEIRRLTPTECERLQGFEDSWTAKGIMDGEEVEISDTQRYKCLGNAVTVNVIEAITSKMIKEFYS